MNQCVRGKAVEQENSQPARRLSLMFHQPNGVRRASFDVETANETTVLAGGLRMILEEPIRSQRTVVNARRLLSRRLDPPDAV